MQQIPSSNSAHLERRRAIAEVLVKHGFRALVSGLGLHRLSATEKGYGAVGDAGTLRVLVLRSLIAATMASLYTACCARRRRYFESGNVSGGTVGHRSYRGRSTD